MSSKNHTTSIALFTYRKIKSLKEIITEIERFEPQKIFIFHNSFFNKKDRDDVENVREFLVNYNFSIDCELVFSEKHYKINDQYFKSLNYAFTQVYSLIILEDDILPNESFFHYCEYMLEKFKDNEKIGCISGSNLNAVSSSDTYFTSYISAPYWGWATWKNRWECYRTDLFYWKERRYFIQKRISMDNRLTFTTFFDGSDEYKYVTWDVLWNLALMANDFKTIIPGQNLISNIGFNNKGTTTNYKRSKYSNQKKYSINLSEIKYIEDCYNEQLKLENSIVKLYKEIKLRQKIRERFYDDFTDL